MRPIGKNVWNVCQVLDCGEAMTYRQVSDQLPDMGLHNASKYLVRAEKLGLVTCNREMKPHQFRAIPGWADMASAERRRKASKPAARIVNSVWQLGAQ